jgi:2'-5' RNA ligase
VSAGDLIAIDVLLEPGPKMLEQAAQWNARMREQAPQGFALDANHRPHITLLQRHIAVDDLEAVLAAVERVRQDFDIAAFGMTATGLYDVPLEDQGLAGITIEPTPQLHALQRAVIDAVNPYDQGIADERAYVPDPTGAPFDPFMFEYVKTYVPKQTGENFNPHLTIGIAPRDWLDRVEKQPFEKFEFGAQRLAVYQLGNFGTAARRLDRD